MEKNGNGNTVGSPFMMGLCSWIFCCKL